MIEIRKVNLSEAQLISGLAIRSKAHWGYDKDFMESCVVELSHSKELVADDQYRYFLAEQNSEVLGFYKLANLHQQVILLEALFIDPASIGQGVGRELFEHAKQIAIECGGTTLEAQSDSFAESFYLAMGATVTGRQESGSIAGRFLPMIRIELENVV